jgi:hypothetical protein
MAKITLKKTVKKTNAPKVNETGLEEVEVTPEVIEEVKEWAKEMKELKKQGFEEVISPEEKFIEGLDRLIEAQILAGGSQYLPKEAVLNVFRSAVKI